MSGERGVAVSGVFQTTQKGSGALRDPDFSFQAGPEDPAVPAALARQFGLVDGAVVTGWARRGKQGITLAEIATIGGGGYWAWKRSQESNVRPDLIVDTVNRGAFDHIVLEQGELESSSNVDIICEVRSRSGSQGTPILWVVDEGTSVKEGDKLVELDE